jgi:hypothetical protein
LFAANEKREQQTHVSLLPMQMENGSFFSLVANDIHRKFAVSANVSIYAYPIPD